MRIDEELPRLKRMILDDLVPFSFYPQGSRADWNGLIAACNNEIKVVCYYIGQTWINDHRNALLSFLAKPNSSMAIYLPNLKDDEIVSHTYMVYDKTKEKAELRDRIELTEKYFSDLLANGKLKKSKISIKTIPKVTNVTLMMLDNKWLAIGYFEINNNAVGDRSDWPNLIIDLEKSPDVRHFAVEQFDTMRRLSIKRPTRKPKRAFRPPTDKSEMRAKSIL